MATKEKTRSNAKQPTKHALRGQVVEGRIVEGKGVGTAASRTHDAEAPRPTGLHPQTLQRLDPLTKTYQTAGMRAEEARQRALNELREAERKGELP
jgi:hypothetical protein